MDEPKLFQHLTRLYNELAKRSEDRTFVGNLREVFNTLGLSPAYSSILYGKLRDMGCIEMVQRGAGHRPSIVNLNHQPQMEQFQAVREREHRLTRRPTLRTLENRLYAIEKRLPNGVDLAAWITGIEQRLAALEGEAGDR